MYKNINTSFNMLDKEQRELYDFLVNRKNVSGFIKEVLMKQMEVEKRKPTIHKGGSNDE